MEKAEKKVKETTDKTAEASDKAAAAADGAKEEAKQAKGKAEEAKEETKKKEWMGLLTSWFRSGPCVPCHLMIITEL